MEIDRKEVLDLIELLDIFEKSSYNPSKANDTESLEYRTLEKCQNLLHLDYTLVEIDNSNFTLCPRYPSKIFIPEYERTLNTNSQLNTATSSNPLTTSTAPTPMSIDTAQSSTNFSNISNYDPFSIKQQDVIYEDVCDTTKINELITMAKFARCRQRFPVPVILYKGKYICRSATISVLPETYGRKVADLAYTLCSYSSYIMGGGNSGANDDPNNDGNNGPGPSRGGSNRDGPSRGDADNDDPNNGNADDADSVNSYEPSPFSYDEVMKSDVQLINCYNVSTIVDLMVEQCKKKYFMTVSSSEKAHLENHYKEFNILALPYPGCEFFKKFRDNDYLAEDLVYNWNQSFNDANIMIPKNGPAYDMDINWSEYRRWDLIKITQNYLKAILKYVQDVNSGILIHCISGWDRTPLFISLLRLSLWADGLIHQSLNAYQMTYFTIAFDWYLYGHQLPDRLKYGEDIMLFCFHVLKYITDEEFSIAEQRKRTKTASSSGSSVVILKSDDDSMREDSTANEDSNDSFYNPDMSTENNHSVGNLPSRSPNSKRSKTSPISVPQSRQRQESTSSNSSWTLVTDAGSIESNMNGSSFMRNHSSKEGKSIGSIRKQRLNAVRTIMIRVYGKTVGFQFKEGSSRNMSSFIGLSNITDSYFKNL